MFPLDPFFPSSLYKTQCKQEPAAVPHFLIALGQPDQTIRTQIDKRDPNYQETRFGLTALAVATLKGNHTIVTYLLKEKGADPKLAAFSGLKPLHFAAALNDVTSIQLLQEAEKVKQIQLDRFVLFPSWKPILMPQFPQPDEVVCYSLSGQPMTATQFQQITAAQFSSGIIATENNFVLSLADRLEIRLDLVRLMNLEFSKQYALFEKQPVKLLLGPQGKAGVGVFAGEDLKPMQVCGVYSGELGARSSHEMEYMLDTVNGKKVGNLCSRINDGFPNCSFFPIWRSDGIKIYVLVPLREIKEKEPLYWSYGGVHPIKLGLRDELNFQEMLAYFKDHPFQQVVLEMEQGLKPPLTFSFSVIGSRLTYLFHTPKALFSLIFEGVISPLEVQKVFDNKLLFTFLDVPITQTAMLKKGMQVLKNFYQMGVLEKLAPFFQKCLDHYSSIAFSTQIEYFASSLLKPSEEMFTIMERGCEAMDLLFEHSLSKEQVLLPQIVLDQLQERLPFLPKEWAEKNLKPLVIKFPNLNTLFQ